MSEITGRQITTITFFRFSGFFNKAWGLLMMQFAHKDLLSVQEQKFYKLMGSGKGLGFNPLPDWSVYSMLQVWENEAAAKAFFEESNLIQRYRSHATELWTLYMKNITAKGEWSGHNPFQPSQYLDTKNAHVAIITRATIKVSKLRSFWKYVPVSQKALLKNDGLIYTKGIGEVPLIQMATFSVWENFESVKAFAYQSSGHQGAIKKTRELKWYKEELFSRFQPYHSQGVWEGKNWQTILFDSRSRNNRHDS